MSPRRSQLPTFALLLTNERLQMWVVAVDGQFLPGWPNEYWDKPPTNWCNAKSFGRQRCDDGGPLRQPRSGAFADRRHARMHACMHACAVKQRSAFWLDALVCLVGRSLACLLPEETRVEHSGFGDDPGTPTRGGSYST